MRVDFSSMTQNIADTFSEIMTTVIVDSFFKPKHIKPLTWESNCDVQSKTIRKSNETAWELRKFKQNDNDDNRLNTICVGQSARMACVCVVHGYKTMMTNMSASIHCPMPIKAEEFMWESNFDFHNNQTSSKGTSCVEKNNRKLRMADEKRSKQCSFLRSEIKQIAKMNG